VKPWKAQPWKTPTFRRYRLGKMRGVMLHAVAGKIVEMTIEMLHAERMTASYSALAGKKETADRDKLALHVQMHEFAIQELKARIALDRLIREYEELSDGGEEGTD
jgi:hypothetical protein